MLTGMPWCGRKEQKNNLINTFFFKKKILKTQQSKIKLRSKEKKVQNSATCCRSALQKKKQRRNPQNVGQTTRWFQKHQRWCYRMLTGVDVGVKQDWTHRWRRRNTGSILKQYLFLFTTVEYTFPFTQPTTTRECKWLKTGNALSRKTTTMIIPENKFWFSTQCIWNVLSWYQFRVSLTFVTLILKTAKNPSWSLITPLKGLYIKHLENFLCKMF